MSERKEFAHMLRTRSADAVVLTVTFLLTVFTSLTVAVGAGLVLAVLLFLKRTISSVSITQAAPDAENNDFQAHVSAAAPQGQCPQINTYIVDGPLFFGTAYLIDKAMAERIERPGTVTILRMNKVPYLDTTGESYLLQAIRRLRELPVTVLVSGLQGQPRQLLTRTGVLSEIGENNLFANNRETLQFAISDVIDHDRCRGCTQNAFQQCRCLSEGEELHELRAAKF